MGNGREFQWAFAKSKWEASKTHLLSIGPLWFVACDFPSVEYSDRLGAGTGRAKFEKIYRKTSSGQR